MNLRRVLSNSDVDQIRANQNKVYSEKLVMTDIVPAGTTKKGRVGISHIGQFYCTHLTGSYESLSSISANIIDTGVCYLRGQLVDGSGMRLLFADFIPFDLIFSPGRRKSASAANVVEAVEGVAVVADASQPLYEPLEFERLFEANSDIFFDVKNDSNVELAYSVCFHGYRIVK